MFQFIFLEVFYSLQGRAGNKQGNSVFITGFPAMKTRFPCENLIKGNAYFISGNGWQYMASS